MISQSNGARRRAGVAALLVAVVLVLAGCDLGNLRDELPSLPTLPGLPEELRQIPDALRDLQLPDLSGVNLPGLDSLPALQTPPNAIVYNGPTERGLARGERIPGTDITFVEVRDGAALFRIAGLESLRRTGDSLDYDGAWPGLPGSSYHARLRLYRIGSDSVRVAGVHQLLIPDINPVEGQQAGGPFSLTFPFLDAVARDTERIAGTTYGYMGRYDRGAQLSGLPANVYPYRSVGDSIEWKGSLRRDVGVSYALRLLAYGVDGMRLGGTVTVTLPGQ